MAKKSTPKSKAGKKVKKSTVKRAKAEFKQHSRIDGAVVSLSDIRKAAQRKAKKTAAAKAVQKKPVTLETGENTANASSSVFGGFFTPFEVKNFTGLNLFEMEKIMTKQDFKFDNFTADAASMSREQMEAFLKFQTTFTKGVEDIMRTAASLTQSAAEKQAEYAKQLMGAKTINEFSAAQNKIAQASFDEFMAGATKISEMSVKVMNDSLAPLNDQMAKGMQKASKKAA